jgi:hypothetical protein
VNLIIRNRGPDDLWLEMSGDGYHGVVIGDRIKSGATHTVYVYHAGSLIAILHPESITDPAGFLGQGRREA